MPESTSVVIPRRRPSIQVEDKAVRFHVRLELHHMVALVTVVHAPLKAVARTRNYDTRIVDEPDDDLVRHSTTCNARH